MNHDIAELLSNRCHWMVLQGEALATLAKLPDASFDALVTDPPYSSGGQYRGDRAASTGSKYVQGGRDLRHSDFTGDNRDQRGFAYWCALWMSEARRVLKPGAPVCIFTDWRQLPITTDAFQAGGFVWRGIVPWDKTEAVRPQLGRFRSQCEYLVWGSNGPMPLERNAPVLPGVIRKDVDPGEKYHQTGKPVEVMEAVCRIVEPGGVVLDPFAGSGSTMVGAWGLGLRSLGIEVDEGYVAIARERMQAAESGLTLRQARERVACPQGLLDLSDGG